MRQEDLASLKTITCQGDVTTVDYFAVHWLNRETEVHNLINFPASSMPIFFIISFYLYSSDVLFSRSYWLDEIALMGVSIYFWNDNEIMHQIYFIGKKEVGQKWLNFWPLTKISTYYVP